MTSHRTMRHQDGPSIALDAKLKTGMCPVVRNKRSSTDDAWKCLQDRGECLRGRARCGGSRRWKYYIGIADGRMPRHLEARTTVSPDLGDIDPSILIPRHYSDNTNP